MYQYSVKPGYGRAAVFVGIVPIIAFPIFVFLPLLSLAFGLFAILLGALSRNTSSHKSGTVGLILGIIDVLYLLMLLLGL